MSDMNVVPVRESVDLPSEYAPEAGVEAESLANTPAEGPEEEPVSLESSESNSNDEESGEEEILEEESEEVEFIEFDFGGNKLEVKSGDIPHEVAEKLEKFSKDIWADYTKKSQVNAEVARTLKAHEEAFATIENLGTEALNAFALGKNVKAEIEQLSAINLQELWRSNPDNARQITDLKAAKQAELQSIINEVDQYERQLIRARQEDLARRTEEGRSKLDRKFKGFSTEIAPKLEMYVQETYGMSAEEAAQWSLSPDVTEMAYKAMLYDQMRSANKQKKITKTAKPVTAMPNKGGGKSTRQNDVSFGELGKILGLT